MHPSRGIPFALVLLFVAVSRLPAQDLADRQDHAIPVAQPESKSHTYVLAPNDVVDIKVYRQDDLTTKARVSRDGLITFPLIGAVHVGGKTIEEAGEQIRARLDKDYLVNPQVTLIVSEYSKRRFTILGQVQKPGSFEIPSNETVTLLEAIAMAGGYTRLADKAHVRVMRTNGDQAESLVIDAKHESAMAATIAFQIKPDDTVTVPERFF